MVLALIAGACTSTDGGSSPTDPTSPTTSTTAPSTTTTTLMSTEALLSFETCMADNGVEIEPIVIDAQGRPRLDFLVPDIDLTDQAQVEAWTACSEFLVAGALNLASNPVLMDNVVGLLEEFSECVRAHGVPDFPDPIPGFAGVGGPYPVAEIPFADPDLGGAVEACRERLG